MAKKTFNQKLNDVSQEFEIVDLSNKPEFVSRYNAVKMLIAPPTAYNEIMAKVPAGRILTSDKIREYLAKNHGAEITCPLTAGIFINICANAAAERNDKNFPYWRTTKSKGELNEKYPGGIDAQKVLLEMEDIAIIQKGRRCFVKDFESILYKL